MMYQFLQSCSQLVASGLTEGTNSINSSLSYKLPMGGLIILPLVLMLWLPFVPESPTWFVSKNKHDKAAQALRKIHRSNQGFDVEREVEFLEKSKAYEEAKGEDSSWMDLIRNPVERKKTLWAAGGQCSQQICGYVIYLQHYY